VNEGLQLTASYDTGWRCDQTPPGYLQHQVGSALRDLMIQGQAIEAPAPSLDIKNLMM
jgi:hypothetical protein